MSTAARAPRADAVRNRARVVQAAIEVLGEKGPAAGIDEVAARAGVGKATVYRSFPTKDDLVAAVALERLRWFGELALAASESEDAGAALRGFLEAAAESQRADRMLFAAVAAAQVTPAMRDARAAVTDAVTALLERGKAQGTVRADAEARDIRMLLHGAAQVLNAEEERDPAVWRRCAGLVADALRP